MAKSNPVPDLCLSAGEKLTVDVPEVYNCLEKIPLASDEAVKLYGK